MSNSTLKALTVGLAFMTVGLSAEATQGAQQFFNTPAPKGGADRFCHVLDQGRNQLCVTGVRVFRRADVLIARMRVDVGRAGKPAHNEYMIWNDCGSPQFRILSREPQSVPPIERWTSVDAISDQAIHKALRAMGTWACNRSVVAGV